MAFLAGKAAGVVVGATSYRFSNWRLSVKMDALDVTNYGSAGFRENIAGLGSATINVSGKLDAGNMAFTAGTVYTLVLQASGSVSFTVAARLESIDVSAPVENVVDATLNFVSTGTFTPAIS